MPCNPCCCMKPKDGAVVCGIWSVIYALASIAVMAWQTQVLNNCRSVTMSQSNLQCEYYCPCVGASTARTSRIVFGVAQLGLMGWQLAAIKYEKDRAANTLLPNYNTYGRYDIPTYYESYWQTPEERYYIGLFIIQILCLISAFFLLFAGVALIYGIHTWSRYLIWPWFVCMLSSILSSLAYCIMWWAGDVRDYWLALTIIEFIGVLINILATVVVSTFYTRIKAEWDYYEKKSRYRPGSRAGHSSRKDLLEHRWEYPEPDRMVVRPFPSQANQNAPYLPSYPSPFPPQPNFKQTGPPPPPLPKKVPPYPEDPNLIVPTRYDREPGSRIGGGAVPHLYKSDDDDDLVSSWVKDQQRRSQHGSKADSEPPYLGGHNYPLKPSRSMPSLFEDSASCHRAPRHRSSSRYRSSHRDRDRDRERDRDRDRDRDRHRGDRDKRHRSSRDHRDHSRRSYRRGRNRSVGYGSDSEETATDYTRCRHSERKRHRSSSRHRYDESETELSAAPLKDRKGRRSGEQERSNGQVSLPLSGGLTIPQHIVIPPQHQMERNPDGTIQPQKFNINSEIVIKYDKDGSDVHFSSAREPYHQTTRSNISHLSEPRRLQPVSMQSNV
ncbi:unnamed protein product, partial [Mesorhabditis spiculigera]